jgi:hypothetical protein
MEASGGQAGNKLACKAAESAADSKAGKPEIGSGISPLKRHLISVLAAFALASFC